MCCVVESERRSSVEGVRQLDRFLIKGLFNSHKGRNVNRICVTGFHLLPCPTSRAQHGSKTKNLLWSNPTTVQRPPTRQLKRSDLINLRIWIFLVFITASRKSCALASLYARIDLLAGLVIARGFELSSISKTHLASLLIKLKTLHNKPESLFHLFPYY